MANETTAARAGFKTAQVVSLAFASLTFTTALTPEGIVLGLRLWEARAVRAAFNEPRWSAGQA
jgi:hypothetical protein